MKTRSIMIAPQAATGDITVTEHAFGLYLQTASSGVTLNYDEIQELLDAIHTLQPTRPNGKEAAK